VVKIDSSAFELPEDSASLQAMVQQLQVELLRVKLELERYKKWYYGPRADRLQSDQDVAQLLLNFAEELDQKPINTDDLPKAAEPAEELRRVKRRKGTAQSGQLRKSACHHACLRTERSRAGLPLLRPDAQGDRRR
jgi:hypothetical protein